MKTLLTILLASTLWCAFAATRAARTFECVQMSVTPAPVSNFPLFPAAVVPPDETNVVAPEWPPLLITNRVSFDVPLRITNGVTRFVVVSNWLTGAEMARVLVPEPTGLRAIWGKVTNGSQSWWQPVAWSNLTQIIHLDFTNAGPVGLFTISTQ